MQEICFFLCWTNNFGTLPRNLADLGYGTVLVIVNHVQTKNNESESCHGTSPVVLDHYMVKNVHSMGAIALSLGPPRDPGQFPRTFCHLFFLLLPSLHSRKYSLGKKSCYLHFAPLVTVNLRPYNPVIHLNFSHSKLFRNDSSKKLSPKNAFFRSFFSFNDPS